ncbi:molybdopterin-dependent oxidoreductase [Candidatus Villigracilis affinis]|uniref:molybdopterin-dependent oxidoreductase n=1 Tax=Candidatus Villigracilis affinis TaxID=3140682 RepID=UPI0031F0D80E
MRAQALTSAEGVLGVPRLQNNIKLIYAVATNCLINQHADVNRSAEILRDESKVEFIVVQDNFLTPTGMFADIILPACTQFETWGVEDGWKYGDEVILQPKLVEPPGESKSDYRICADLAERLGIGEAFTEGRDEKDWVDYCLQVFRSTRFPELPTLDEFIEKNLGAWSNPVTNPKIAFADFRADPMKYPLNTPSGKIEIFSKQLHDMGNPNEIPAVPKYIQEWENPFRLSGARERSPGWSKCNSRRSLRHREIKRKTPCPGCGFAGKRPCTPRKKGLPGEYTLQAIGHHTLARVHLRTLTTIGCKKPSRSEFSSTR